MKKKEETRGAPKGNQNAKKERRKEYVQVFGQRWSIEEGNRILSYLEREKLTQKAFLVKVVSEYILSDISG